jgi:predicted DNA-binding protein (MmcQ/YjbR family)
MDAERARAFLRGLPHVAETVQWGAKLVFWVGDRAVGGKMFAVIDLEGEGRAVLSFATEPEGYAELLERDGVIPAPYLARAHWVGLERWNALRWAELQERLRTAHGIVAARLSKRTRSVLEMPAAKRKQLIAERRKVPAKKAPEEGQ